jgi:glycyl-tRNA synthetase beta chain
MYGDLLLEIGCEELPSRSVRPLAEALSSLILSALAEENLTHGEAFVFASPRRIALIVQDVQLNQASKKISRRGPAIIGSTDSSGNPTPALHGFARSCGVNIAELTQQKTDKGEWWAYESELSGSPTAEILPKIVNQAVAKLPIAKGMRWGEGIIEFARPVHWVVLMLGEKVIPATVLGIEAGSLTRGHRFHAPQMVEVTHIREYTTILKNAYVQADFEARKETIKAQIMSLAKQLKYKAIMPDSLLEEVTSIVEWPQALIVNFEPHFLKIPQEALIAAMQVHQKCFALQDSQNKLVPHFITVANIESQNLTQVIKGNEKVMRARLSDAAFFYEQDQKQGLAQYQPLTETVIFQKSLGTLAEKTQRVAALIQHLEAPLNLHPQHTARAALLSKCDLMTGMVGEFPELQGLMGYYYALYDNEPNEVAVALKDYYLPRFSQDELPTTKLGAALSLCDRLDTLVGNFAIGQIPSGAKDPFKLRRHALAVARILIAEPAALLLSELIQLAINAYQPAVTPSPDLANQVKQFILERLQSYYASSGISADRVQAVLNKQNDCLSDLDKRLKALQLFTQRAEAVSLSSASKRVKNIIQQNQLPEDAEINEKMLIESAELSLYRELCAMNKVIQPLYEEGDYTSILTALAGLKEPVDAFFEQVMVMTDDKRIRDNRLRLLAGLQKSLQGVADISQLQSPTS